MFFDFESLRPTSLARLLGSCHHSSLTRAFGLLVWLLFLGLATALSAQNSFVEIQKVTPSAATTNTALGSFNSVDISGDWAVAGGAKVFVLHRDQGGPDNWGVVKELTPSTGGSANGFGASAAISGETIAVGAPLETVGLPSQFDGGAVYIYKKDQGGTNNWGEVQRIVTGNGEDQAGNRFGTDVALGLSGLLVGIPQSTTGATGAGIAQIWEETSNAWAHQYTLVPSDGADNDSFGSSVDFYNDVAVVGSLGWPDKKAYLYTLPAVGAPTETKIYPQGGANAPGTFGTGLAIQGTTLAISNQGVVEVFDRNEGGTNNWGGVDVVVGPNSSFGNALDVYGSTLIVGNLNDSSARGKASLYEANGSSWAFRQDIVASDGVGGDFFSAALALDFETAIVGAPEDDNAEGNGAGAVYVFEDVPAVDLTITTDDGRSTLPRGDVTTYTVQATNASSADVTDAIVDVDILLGVIDVALSSWTCAPDIGATVATSCPSNGTVGQLASGVLVDLGAGESVTFLFEVQTDDDQPPATLQCRGTVTPPAGLLDPVPDNDSALDVDSFVNEADVSVLVSSPPRVDNGEVFVMAASVSSQGPSLGTTWLDIDLPPQLTYLGLAGPATRGDDGPPCSIQSAGSSTMVRCVSSLRAGESTQFDLQVQADPSFEGLVQIALGLELSGWHRSRSQQQRRRGRHADRFALRGLRGRIRERRPRVVDAVN